MCERERDEAIVMQMARYIGRKEKGRERAS